jgi:hypothetical protein
VLDDLVDEIPRVEALALQPPLQIDEGQHDRVDGSVVDVEPQLLDAQGWVGHPVLRSVKVC